MKHTIAFLCLCLSVGLMAQSEEFGHPKIRSANSVVWFGLDFTQANLVGHDGFTNPDDIVNRFWDSWNNLMIDEADKYDVPGQFMKSAGKHDLTTVRERNATIGAEGLVKDAPHEISKADVEAVVATYSSTEYPEGVGILYVVENFNKPKEEATIWVTAFDIASHEVLKTKRFRGEPRGFGLRNYWAGAILDVMEQMGKDYKRWLKNK